MSDEDYLAGFVNRFMSASEHPRRGLAQLHDAVLSVFVSIAVGVSCLPKGPLAREYLSKVLKMRADRLRVSLKAVERIEAELFDALGRDDEFIARVVARAHSHSISEIPVP